MGINRFWEVLKGHDSKDPASTIIKDVNLAELASEHIARTGRPYRVAVDAAYWHYKNVDTAQTKAIRKESQRASNPSEKQILYRTLRYAKLGIQCLFVFDGPRRPRKRNSQHIYTSSDWDSGLLKKTLKAIGVPCWYAPGEAEAECAAPQSAGHVDAVFSSDGDSFMFGATAVMTFKKDGQKKSNDVVHMIEAKDIVKSFPGLDRDGTCLFALITGNDYDQRGLPKCGDVAALEVIKAGFGRSLVAAFQSQDLIAWKEKLQQHFQDHKRPVTVLNSWASAEIVGYCLQPSVRTPEKQQQLGHNHYWNNFVDLEELKTVLTSRFNFSVQEFITWLPPVILVRRLLNNEDTAGLNIETGRKVSRKEFGSAPVTNVLLDLDALDIRQGYLTSWPMKDTRDLARIKVYDHEPRVSCDVLNCLLKAGGLEAPAEVKISSKKRRLDQAETPKPAKKRKSNEHTDSASLRDGQSVVQPVSSSIVSRTSTATSCSTPVLGTSAVKKKNILDIDDCDESDIEAAKRRNKTPDIDDIAPSDTDLSDFDTLAKKRVPAPAPISSGASHRQPLTSVSVNIPDWSSVPATPKKAHDTSHTLPKTPKTADADEIIELSDDD